MIFIVHPRNRRETFWMQLNVCVGSCLVVLAGELGEHIRVQFLVLFVRLPDDTATFGDLFVCRRVFGIDRDDTIEVGQRCVCFASAQTRLATPVESLHIVRLNLEHGVALRVEFICIYV